MSRKKFCLDRSRDLLLEIQPTCSRLRCRGFAFLLRIKFLYLLVARHRVVRRERGRKAHETAVIPIIPTRYTTVVASWIPEIRFDVSAPVRLNTTPAYAHSFNRGKRGMIIAIEPRSFQTPKMTRK